MFAVIYQFEVHEGYEEQFVLAWSELTELIKKHCGGWGSRLHRSSTGIHIGYAQWPDEITWRNAPDLPSEANQLRTKMREACASIQVLHELEMVKDLLVTFES